MEGEELLEEARAALGVSSFTPLRPGGQKLVFRAELEGTQVVVKVVPFEQPFAEEALVRARREVDLLAEIDSPFVVRVLSEAVEVGEPPHAVCWVEEMLDGEDLSALLGDRWQPTDVLRLLQDVGAGLLACHELDVVHRDLSPGNIRRRSNGRFVLMDPGYARHLAKTAITGHYQPGTMGYISPEHVPGGQPIPASDVFALGILAFRALTGKLPFDPSSFPTMNDYLVALTEQQAPKVQDLHAEVPASIAAIVDKCLQRQPARRFLDARELLAATEDIDL